MNEVQFDKDIPRLNLIINGEKCNEEPINIRNFLMDKFKTDFPIYIMTQTFLSDFYIEKAKTYNFKLTQEELSKKYSKGDEDGAFRELPLKRTGSGKLRQDRPYMFFPFYYNEISGDLILPSFEEYKKIYDGSSFDDDFVESYSNNDGLIIFTAEYLLQRGYCCGNGCKHCPYDYKNVLEPKRSDLLKKRELENKN